MVQSMTGFGKEEALLEDKRVNVEIRTLNNKGFDLSLRTPVFLNSLELDIRKLVSRYLIRGKIDCSIGVHNWVGAAPKINEKVVREYLRQLHALPHTDTTAMLSIAMRLPESLSSDKDELPQEEVNAIVRAVEKALQKVQNHRVEEGKQMADDFTMRLELLEKLMAQIQSKAPERVQKVEEKLQLAFEKAAVKVDSERFEQELIYYLEKTDITEECVRLANHLKYFKEVMEKETPNGKKLGFIAQEMGREINTIGSKANHTDIQRTVVQMKDELEKIREQLMNVL